MKIENLLDNFNPEWALRIGLGLTYLYSSIGLITEPGNWIGFIPSWLQGFIVKFMDLNTYLKIQGGVEILFAFIFLAWFLDKKTVFFTALISALELAGVLALAFLPYSPVNLLVTFRDFGLLGGTLALAALLNDYRRAV